MPRKSEGPSKAELAKEELRKTRQLRAARVKSAKIRAGFCANDVLPVTPRYNVSLLSEVGAGNGGNSFASAVLCAFKALESHTLAVADDPSARKPTFNAQMPKSKYLRMDTEALSEWRSRIDSRPDKLPLKELDRFVGYEGIDLLSLTEWENCNKDIALVVWVAANQTPLTPAEATALVEAHEYHEPVETWESNAHLVESVEREALEVAWDAADSSSELSEDLPAALDFGEDEVGSESSSVHEDAPRPSNPYLDDEAAEGSESSDEGDGEGGYRVSELEPLEITIDPSNFRDEFVILEKRLWTSPYLRSVKESRDEHGHKVWVKPHVIHLVYYPAAMDNFFEDRAAEAEDALTKAEHKLESIHSRLLSVRQTMTACNEAILNEDLPQPAVEALQRQVADLDAQEIELQLAVIDAEGIVEKLHAQQRQTALEETQLFGRWEYIRDTSQIRCRDETMRMNDSMWRNNKFCDRCLSEYRRPNKGEVHSCGIGPEVKLPPYGYKHRFRQWKAAIRQPVFMVWDTEAMLVPQVSTNAASNTQIINKQVVGSVSYLMVAQHNLDHPTANFLKHHQAGAGVDCMQMMLDTLASRAAGLYTYLNTPATKRWHPNEKERFLQADTCILCKKRSLYNRMIELKDSDVHKALYHCITRYDGVIGFIEEKVTPSDPEIDLGDSDDDADEDEDKTSEGVSETGSKPSKSKREPAMRKRFYMQFGGRTVVDQHDLFTLIAQEWEKHGALDICDDIMIRRIVEYPITQPELPPIFTKEALLDRPGPEYFIPPPPPEATPTPVDSPAKRMRVVDEKEDDIEVERLVIEFRGPIGPIGLVGEQFKEWILTQWETFKGYVRAPFFDTVTGRYLGAAHAKCVGSIKKCEEITCWAHNAVKYDNHYLQRAIHMRKVGLVEVPYKLSPKQRERLKSGDELFNAATGNPIYFNEDEEGDDAWTMMPSESFDAVVDNTEHLKIIRWKVFAGIDSWKDRVTGKKTHHARWLTYVWHDSLAHFLGSLDALTSKLSDADKHISKKYFYDPENPIRYKILSKKGTFPYAYFDSPSKIAGALPAYETWNSTNALCGIPPISKGEYDTIAEQYKQLGCTCFGDFLQAYNSSDVAILADVLRTYSKKCYSQIGVDPLCFSSASSFAWNAMLFGGVEFGLMHEMDQFEFMEEACRGGLSMISSSRLCKVNNPYMHDYNPEERTSWMVYLDANSLYPTAMRHKLPFECEGWVADHMSGSDEDTEYWRNYIMNWREDPPGCDENDVSEGCWLSVDLEYPDHLHDLHRSYPLAPVKGIIPKSWMSDAQKAAASIEEVSVGSTTKLFPYLGPRTEYPVYVQVLQLYLSLGMVLKKVHKVLRFKIARVLKPWIDRNVADRQIAKAADDKVGQEMSKIGMNGVYGRSLMNERKHTKTIFLDVGRKDSQLKSNLRHNHRRATDLAIALSSAVYPADLAVSNGTEDDSNPFSNMQRVLLRIPKKKHVLKQPLFVGATILDLSKWWMYKFMYEVLLPQYIPVLREPGAITNPEVLDNLTVDELCRVQLHMMDTDSMLLRIETENVYDDMKNPEGRILPFMDLSGEKDELSLYAPRKDGRPPTCRLAVPGYFKDEASSEAGPVHLTMIVSFVGVAAKLYAIQSETGSLVDAGILQHVKKVGMHPDHPDPWEKKVFTRGDKWDEAYAKNPAWFDKYLPTLVHDTFDEHGNLKPKTIVSWIGVRKAKGIDKRITSATVSDISFKAYWNMVADAAKAITCEFADEQMKHYPSIKRLAMTNIRSRKTSLHTMRSIKKALGAVYDKQWTANGIDLLPYGHKANREIEYLEDSDTDSY